MNNPAAEKLTSEQTTTAPTLLCEECRFAFAAAYRNGRQVCVACRSFFDTVADRSALAEGKAAARRARQRKSRRSRR